MLHGHFLICTLSSDVMETQGPFWMAELSHLVHNFCESVLVVAQEAS